MVAALPFSALLALSGCGLKSILPSKPVAKEAHIRTLEAQVASPAAYTDQARTDFPIIPLTTFGLQYAVDVVFVSEHPDWDMHEYARLDVDGQSIWIAKDSTPSGVQTIIADVDDLEAWMPEIAVPRIQAPIVLKDRTQGSAVDIEMTYTNPNGQLTEIWAKGALPSKPPAKRNGNTMGHSRDVVAAVLDIERFGSRIDGGISIDGEAQKFDRILGLVPFRFLLKQTQAGVVVTNFRLMAAEDGFQLIRPSPSDPDWPTRSKEGWAWDGSTALYDNGVVEFEYRFIDGGLSAAQVRQHGLSEPTFNLHITPALPDLRRHFAGTLTSRFAMHVNGQKGHGTGSISARWTSDSTVEVHFVPDAPFWLADRPMKTVVQFRGDQQVDVRTTRVDQ